MSRHNSRKDAALGPVAGFTLLEMLVVIAIMGLIANLGFASIDRTLNARTFHTATLQIERDVREAHARALLEHRTVSVEPFIRRDARGQVTLVRGVLPTAIEIDQPSAIRFFRDGTSTGGTIDVVSGRLKSSISVDAATGMIKVRGSRI